MRPKRSPIQSAVEGIAALHFAAIAMTMFFDGPGNSLHCGNVFLYREGAGNLQNAVPAEVLV
jgi:hypothetical protein